MPDSFFFNILPRNCSSCNALLGKIEQKIINLHEKHS